MDKLRVGVLGLRRGRSHLSHYLAMDEAVVIGAADRLETYREPMREKVEEQGGTMVAEYDELLAMKPDAIVIATNGRMQVEHSCQALEAGIPVLSEIPGAFHEEELVKLRDTVERTGTFYMLAENTCFYDFFRWFRRWFVEGRLGELSLAEGEYLHYIIGSLVTRDGRGLSPSQAKAEGVTDVKPSWRADQPPIQYLTHDLGPLLEVLDDRCVSVTCRSAPWRCKETPLRSDGQIALFETAKGVLLKILITLSTRRPGEHRYRLFGTEGSAEWFSYEGCGRLFDKDREEREGWEKLDIGTAAKGESTAGHGGADPKCAHTFVKALLNGDPSPIDVYRAIEYCLPGIVANRSAELGGLPLPITDYRRSPFSGTNFWNVVGLPEGDPPPMVTDEERSKGV